MKENLRRFDHLTERIKRIILRDKKISIFLKIRRELFPTKGEKKADMAIENMFNQ